MRVKKIFYENIFILLFIVITINGCNKSDTNSPCVMTSGVSRTVTFCPNTYLLDSAQCKEVLLDSGYKIGLMLEAHNIYVLVDIAFDSIFPKSQTYKVVNDIKLIDSTHCLLGIQDDYGDIWLPTSGDIIFSNINGHASATTSGSIILTKKGSSTTNTFSGNMICQN